MLSWGLDSQVGQQEAKAGSFSFKTEGQIGRLVVDMKITFGVFDSGR